MKLIKNMTEQNSKEETMECKRISLGKISDLSTEVEEKSNNTTQIEIRYSIGDSCEFGLFEVPITPKSTLFLKPSDSPQYSQLNHRLRELYNKFENEFEIVRIGKCSEKTVQVTNTALSSLMMRRNKSESTIRKANLY